MTYTWALTKRSKDISIYKNLGKFPWLKIYLTCLKTYTCTLNQPTLYSRGRILTWGAI